jgi:methionine sulfoxide reductase heme-binding subunit
MNHLFTSFSHLFPVWNITRAAGITSYLLLFLSLVSGLLIGLKAIPTKVRPMLTLIHTTGGWFGFLFGMLHGLILLDDHYVGYTLSDIFNPFTSRTDTFLNGIGTLSLYCLLLVMISSDLMKRIGRRAWKVIHFLTFPCFVMALYHGIALGTDTSMIWMKWTYLSTGIIVFTLMAFRVGKRNKPLPSRG